MLKPSFRLFIVPLGAVDITGVVLTKLDGTAKGGAGWGVRLLDRLVAEHYE